MACVMPQSFGVRGQVQKRMCLGIEQKMVGQLPLGVDPHGGGMHSPEFSVFFTWFPLPRLKIIVTFSRRCSKLRLFDNCGYFPHRGQQAEPVHL